MTEKKKATPRKNVAPPPGPPDWSEDTTIQMSPAARKLYDQALADRERSSSSGSPSSPPRSGGKNV